MAKRWKKADETYLKRYAKIKRLEELAKRFRTDNETVAEKLEEMGLEAKDTVVQMKIENDPLVKVFERGLRAMHKEQFKEARQLFEEVVNETDFPVMGQRARRFLDLCNQHLTKAPRQDADPFLQAVYERNRGNLETALEICTRGGRQSKDERFSYLAASLYALQGEEDKAAQTLETAIQLNPKNRVYAFHDADFEQLRGSEEYSSLFEQS